MPEQLLQYSDTMKEVSSWADLQQCRQAVDGAAVSSLALIMQGSMSSQPFYSTLRPLTKSQLCKLQKASGTLSYKLVMTYRLAYTAAALAHDVISNASSTQ